MLTPVAKVQPAYYLTKAIPHNKSADTNVNKKIQRTFVWGKMYLRFLDSFFLGGMRMKYFSFVCLIQSRSTKKRNTRFVCHLRTKKRINYQSKSTAN